MGGGRRGGECGGEGGVEVGTQEDEHEGQAESRAFAQHRQARETVAQKGRGSLGERKGRGREGEGESRLGWGLHFDPWNLRALESSWQLAMGLRYWNAASHTTFTPHRLSSSPSLCCVPVRGVVWCVCCSVR